MQDDSAGTTRNEKVFKDIDCNLEEMSPLHTCNAKRKQKDCQPLKEAVDTSGADRQTSSTQDKRVVS